MASFARGKVVRVVEERADLVRVVVATGDDEMNASGFPSMLGPLRVGDEVVLNTTGITLGLGTGGEAFVLWNLSAEELPEPGSGHIVKMRYTPWQTEVLSVEAPESPHHDALRSVTGIGAMPVVACGLHSQVPAVCAGIKAAAPEAKVGYLMTDGAALPIAWSRTVPALKEAALLDVTATAGHAFGGDHEAVNVHSGLAALKHVESCSVVIAGMGPGVVGTGTALGFSAIEQATLLDATGALGGKPVACLRVSFADERERHRGLSHHTITALRMASRSGTRLVVPDLGGDENALVKELEEAGLTESFEVIVESGEPGVGLLRDRGLRVSSMGRSLDEIPELFLAAAAAGRVAASLT